MLGTLALPMSALELRNAMRELRVFDPARLDRILRIDEHRSLVEVQSGTSWDALASHPQTAFLAGWMPGRTVGQALAENAAGPDGVPVVKHIDALALVTPDGDLRRLSRTAHPELFRLCVGGQGVFGFAYSITLSVPSLRHAVDNAVAPVALCLADEFPSGDPFRLLVPPACLESFIDEARARCREWNTAIGAALVTPTAAEDETVLRWAVRDYAAVSLHFSACRSLGNAVRATQLRRALIDLAIERGGSFPIACTPAATRAQLERCYPTLGSFLAEKRRLDPAGRVCSAWYRHHRSLLSRGSCEVRWGG